ncbi:MAG: carotenoid biosynthesis protein [Bacteroidota bacterium]|nr:carotenoid biosynthesis protein [Bacteroidota bacterium]
MINNKFRIKKFRPVSLFFVIFYLVGTIGLIVPFSFPLFVNLTFLALILSNIGLFVFHYSHRLKHDISIFAVIFLLGFIIESIGVNTGYIFGNYLYGDALGLKLFNTPLLIGLNWLFLTYTGVSISEKISGKTPLQILIVPTIMLVYDLLLEQVAPKMDMWSWSNAQIPVKNYVSWWLIGFVFACIFKLFNINTRNPMALILFLCQFLFFAVLFIVFYIFK